eukprot:1510068-Lingulodinium_polyedra.AAC.1
MAVPPLMAADVWDLLEPEVREVVTGATAISPQYTRLAMGCSHSVLILMSIGLHQTGLAMERSRGLAERHLDDSGAGVLAAWLDQRRRLGASARRSPV